MNHTVHEDLVSPVDDSQVTWLWNHFKDLDVEHEYRKRKNWNYRRLMRYGMLGLFFYFMVVAATARSPRRIEQLMSPLVAAVCVVLLSLRVVFYSWFLPTLVCCAPTVFHFLTETTRSFITGNCELFRATDAVLFSLLVLTGRAGPCELSLLTLIQVAASGVDLWCPPLSPLGAHYAVLVLALIALNFVALTLDVEDRTAYRLELQCHNALSRQLAAQRACRDGIVRQWPEEVVQRVVTHPMERAYDFHSQVGVCVVDLRGAADATANALEAPKVLSLLRRLHAGLEARAAAAGCETVFRHPQEFCCVAGLKGPRDAFDPLLAFASGIRAVAAEVRDEFGVNVEVSAGLSAGWAVLGLVGTRTVHYTLWGLGYSEARDCARAAAAGGVETTAGWVTATTDRLPAAPTAPGTADQRTTADCVTATTDRLPAPAGNGTGDQRVSPRRGSASPRPEIYAPPTADPRGPARPATPPPVMAFGVTLDGGERAVSTSPLPFDTDIPGPRPSPRPSIGALQDSASEDEEEEGDGEGAATPFWGKLLSRLNAPLDTVRGSLEPLSGLVGYAREVVDVMSPVPHSPTPPRRFLLSAGGDSRASAASDFWSDLALADSSRRTSLEFTPSMGNLSVSGAHDRLVTFQTPPGRCQVSAKVSVILPAVTLAPLPRIRPVYKGAHILLPDPHEALFCRAQGMLWPAATLVVGLLILLATAIVLEIGGNAPPVALLAPCAVIFVVGLAAPLALPAAVAPHCYTGARCGLATGPALAAFAVAHRAAATAPAFLFLSNFVALAHLLRPAVGLPSILAEQALHCVGFATAQLLAVYVYLPTVYDPSAGGGTDGPVPDVAILGMLVPPLALGVGLLHAAATAFRRRVAFGAAASGFRTIEAADKATRYLLCLRDPHHRALAGRHPVGPLSTLCDRTDVCMVVAVWLPALGSLDDEEAEDPEGAAGAGGHRWLQVLERRLAQLQHLFEALDESLDGPAAPLAPGCSCGDVYLAHSPLHGGSGGGAGPPDAPAVARLAVGWARAAASYGRCHVAIATGAALGGFFGPDGREIYCPFGDPFTRATRMATETECTVLFDEATKRLLEPDFPCHPSGEGNGTYCPDQGLPAEATSPPSGHGSRSHDASLDNLVDAQDGAVRSAPRRWRPRLPRLPAPRFLTRSAS